MNNYTICVLPGDGIGPEIVDQAIKVLKVIGEIYGLNINIKNGLIGGAAIDKTDTPLPKDTIKLCKESDAVLLGSVGGPKWDNLPPEKRPERGGLLKLREELELFANIRPVILFNDLKNISPLSLSENSENIDLITIRELSSGIYFGKPKKITENSGIDTMVYRKEEVKKIAEIAFKIALKRRRKICSVDKANVLNSSLLWRKTVSDVSKKYPTVQTEHLYIDNAAMQMILNPSQFDVILTSNLFGDILSDESAALTNSLGMLPSASLGDEINLFEPAGGSAPDIAGKNIANPIAQILSLAMMFEYSFGKKNISDHIYASVKNLIGENIRTADICSTGEKPVSTDKFGDLLCEDMRETF